MRAIFTALALVASPLALAQDTGTTGATGPSDVGTPTETAAPTGTDATMDTGAANKPKGKPTEADVDAAKEELKWHKDQAKQVSKLVGKWNKYVEAEKFDKAAEIDAEIKPLLREQMGYLRDMGVTNVGDDLPPASGSPMMVGEEEPTKMETLRDHITELRTQEIEYAKPDGARVQARKAAYNALDQALQSRLERKEKQYDEMKDAVKG